MIDTSALTLECTVDVSDGLNVPASVTEGAVADLVHFALTFEQQTGSWAVSFAFVTEWEISLLHEQFLGDPSLTDIITFPYDEFGSRGGDVAICVPVAAEQGPEHGNSFAEELYFLVLHGVLHLAGHDDASPGMRAAMLRRQAEIYDAWRGVSR